MSAFIKFATILEEGNTLLKVDEVDSETLSFEIHCGSSEALVLKEAMWAMGFVTRFELIGICHYRVIEE